MAGTENGRDGSGGVGGGRGAGGGRSGAGVCRRAAAEERDGAGVGVGQPGLRRGLKRVSGVCSRAARPRLICWRTCVARCSLLMGHE